MERAAPSTHRSSPSLRPVLFGQDHRHPIMQGADERIGRTGDDGTALDALPGFLVRPLVPQACHYHLALVSHRNGVGLLLGFLPFIEAVSDYEAALAPLPSVTKCRRGIDRLRPCVD